MGLPQIDFTDWGTIVEIVAMAGLALVYAVKAFELIPTRGTERLTNIFTLTQAGTGAESPATSRLARYVTTHYAVVAVSFAVLFLGAALFK